MTKNAKLILIFNLILNYFFVQGNHTEEQGHRFSTNVVMVMTECFNIELQWKATKMEPYVQKAFVYQEKEEEEHLVWNK